MLKIRQDQITVLDEHALADSRIRIHDKLRPRASELPRSEGLDLMVWIDRTIARALSYGYLTIVQIEEFAHLAFKLEFGITPTKIQVQWAKTVLAKPAFPADFRLRLVRAELEGTIARAGENGAFLP